MKQILPLLIALFLVSCQRSLEDLPPVDEPPFLGDPSPAPREDAIWPDTAFVVKSEFCIDPPFGPNDPCYKWYIQRKINGILQYPGYHEEYIRFSKISALSEIYVSPPGFLLYKLKMWSYKP